jgi:putative ABC transport system permease protein
VRLAVRELHRRPSRFAVATAILALISMLLIVLGGLLDGLTASSTGALRAQRGQLIVYSSDAEDSLVRSRITPEVRRQVERVAGTDAVSGLGSVQVGARVPGHGPRELVPVVLFGYQLAPQQLPDVVPGTDQVFADSSLKSQGVREGMTIRLGPARSAVRIIGFLDDSRYSGQGTLWGSLDTWRTVISANRPSERAGAGVEQALVVQTKGRSPSVEAAAIDRATGGATKTLTIDQAIQALPGISAQQTTFNQIIGVTVAIGVLVVALFFALITVERVGLYGVLKAIGASSATLFAGVVLQALVVALIASAIGVAAGIALQLAIPSGGSIPFVATPGRLITSTVYLVFAALLGCAFSLRRVLNVDPAAAIGASET